MRFILCMREYLGYKSTFDKLTFVIVELGPIPMELQGRIPRAFTKLGYTCRAIKARAIRILLKKRLCAGLMSEIKFKTIMLLLLNQNCTCYTKVQVVDTFAYV